MITLCTLKLKHFSLCKISYSKGYSISIITKQFGHGYTFYSLCCYRKNFSQNSKKDVFYLGDKFKVLC